MNLGGTKIHSSIKVESTFAVKQSENSEKEDWNPIPTMDSSRDYRDHRDDDANGRRSRPVKRLRSKPKTNDLTGSKNKKNKTAVVEDVDLECPICLDVFLEPHDVVPCNHTFCAPCLKKLSKVNRGRTCPMCRQKIKGCESNKKLKTLARKQDPQAYRKRTADEKDVEHLPLPPPSSYSFFWNDDDDIDIEILLSPPSPSPSPTSDEEQPGGFQWNG